MRDSACGGAGIGENAVEAGREDGTGRSGWRWFGVGGVSSGAGGTAPVRRSEQVGKQHDTGPTRPPLTIIVTPRRVADAECQRGPGRGPAKKSPPPPKEKIFAGKPTGYKKFCKLARRLLKEGTTQTQARYPAPAFPSTTRRNVCFEHSTDS